MVFLFGTILGIVAMFIPLIAEQEENLSLLNIDGIRENIETLITQVDTYFAAYDIDFIKTLRDFDWNSAVSFNAIPNLLNTVLGTIGNLSIGLFSVIFIAFFFMKDSALLHKGIMTFVKDEKEHGATQIFNKIKDLLSRYFIGLLLQISILFILYTIILWIFGIENFVIIAFLCSLLNLIPYVGPLVGAILMLFLSMSSNIGMDFQDVILPTTIKIMIGYVIAQLVDNFVSQPLIFSKSVKSHPLEIFLVIIIAGLLFGVVGMIVAVPGYTAIKVIAKTSFPDFKLVKNLTKDL